MTFFRKMNFSSSGSSDSGRSSSPRRRAACRKTVTDRNLSSPALTFRKTGRASGASLTSSFTPRSSAISLKNLRMKISEIISYCFAMDCVVDCGKAAISINTS